MNSVVGYVGNYLFANLRDHAAGEVDKLVRHVIRLMHSSSKALTVCRILHHLKEGPLLDGPSMVSNDNNKIQLLVIDDDNSNLWMLIF